MVKWKVVGLGIGIIIAFYVLFFVLPGVLGIQVELFSYPLIFLAIILVGMFMGISGFLPYTWGKIFRYISYFCLFILILLLELNVMKIVFEKYHTREITLEACKTLFGEKDKPENVMDAVGIWSCITTGYFPSKGGDLGWTIFAIFYLILPFAFIWTFLYGLMSGMGLESWFGNFGKSANILLSFIISLYATRQLFGFFLLDMYGYGAWGLAGVFGAIFFVKALQHMTENWFKIEQYGKELQDAMKIALEVENDAKKALYTYVNRIKSQRGQSLINSLNSIIGGRGTLQHQAFVNLSSEKQAEVEMIIREITAGRKNINDLLNALK